MERTYRHQRKGAGKKKRPDTGASFNRYYNQYDYFMLLVIIALAVFGLLMIYSVKQSMIRTQAGAMLGGAAAVMLLMGLHNIGLLDWIFRGPKKVPAGLLTESSRKWKGRDWNTLGLFEKLRRAWPNLGYETKITFKLLGYYLKSFPGVLVILVFISLALLPFFGSNLNGSTRWYKIGGHSFQPSEFAKTFFIIFMAYLVYKTPEIVNCLRGYIIMILVFGPSILLIFMENASSAIIIAMIIYLTCLVLSKHTRILVGLGLCAFVALFAFLSLGGGYRSSRIQDWKNVENVDLNTQEAADSQTIQGLFGIAEGGLKGTGIGQGIQKFNIPENYNDMIFAVICEELGLIGGIAVVALFILLIWRIMVIGCAASNLFYSTFCFGVMFHIGVQMLLNIAVVTNTIMNTGVSLPLISYGGTATFLQVVELGYVFIISRNVKISYD
ncbi:MAG: FtsW/RodA/SpoVE family cell cycle protein [Lachnospiraceae bacterium]|nr:FtsW/RodA/SpoVE family cell cycle protein [Lachnospiraceae bacterium]